VVRAKRTARARAEKNLVPTFTHTTLKICDATARHETTTLLATPNPSHGPGTMKDEPGLRLDAKRTMMVGDDLLDRLGGPIRHWIDGGSRRRQRIATH
jgi:hypothetical protein